MQTYSNRSNARRAGIQQFGEGKFDIVPDMHGKFAIVQYVEEVVTPEPWPFPKAAQFATQAQAVRSAKTRAEFKNGQRKPIKGVCANLWAAFDETPEITVADVRAYALANKLNANNAQLEFYAWRKFNGMAKAK